MAQPIMGTENEEFTTSAFCDGKGGYHAHMTLKRKLSSDGFTDRAEVVEVDDIAGTVHERPLVSSGRSARPISSSGDVREP